MDTEILKYVFSQTVFGGLFFWLLMDTQKKNAEREKRGEERESSYQNIIKELTNGIKSQLEIVEVKLDELKGK